MPSLPYNRRVSKQRSRDTAGLLGLGLSLVVFFGLAFLSIREGAPLGHDEAVYSLRAQWATGDHSVNLSGYWIAYRAPGLPWALTMAWLVRSTEPYLRFVVSLFGGLGVVLTWWMARELFGSRAAVLAATGLAMSPWWMSPSTHVWPDVPGAVLGLATMAVLVWATRGDRVSGWAVLAAPLAVLTTIVRFGAPLSLAVGAVAICWWRWDVVKQSWPIVAATGLLTGAGTALVLFTTMVADGTETPYDAVGRLRSGRERSLFDGFAGYWDLAASELATPVAVALFAGVAAAFLFGWSGTTKRRLMFVGLVSLGTFVILAGTLHAELRYLSPVFPFLWMFAGYGLAELSKQWPRRVLVPVALVVMIPFLLGTTAKSNAGNQDLKERFTVLKDVMAEVEWPEKCRIATSFTPQVGWYSGCQVVGLRHDGNPIPEPENVTHIVDVYASNKEPEGLDEWLVDNAVEVSLYGDPGLGALRAVRILVPKE